MELARKAWAHIVECEAQGGMTKAIEAGLPKMRIADAAARTQARIDSGRQTIVGLNKYRPATDDPINVLKIDNTAVREARSSGCRSCARSATGRRWMPRWMR